MSETVRERRFFSASKSSFVLAVLCLIEELFKRKPESLNNMSLSVNCLLKAGFLVCEVNAPCLWPCLQCGLCYLLYSFTVIQFS